VGDAARGADRLHLEALLEALQSVPGPLPAPEDHGDHRDVHEVDQVGGQELAEARGSAADADVQAACGLFRYVDGFGGAGVDEVEGGAALHGNRGPGVVGEHEHRGAEGRFLTPPALPLIVGPRAPLRAELVAPHDLRADPRRPVARDFVVDAGAAPGLAVYGPGGIGGEEPFQQAAFRVPEGRVDVLALTGAEPVQRDRVDVNAGV